MVIEIESGTSRNGLLSVPSLASRRRSRERLFLSAAGTAARLRRLEWVETAAGEEERRQAALALAATLYAKRLPDEGAVDWKNAGCGESVADLIGIAARSRYSALPALESRRDAPILRADGTVGGTLDFRSESSHASASLPPSSPHAEREVYGLVGRPGEGGRRVSDRRRAVTEETRKLLARLGEPYERRTVAGNVTVMRWSCDPDSDSSWFIRLSPTQQDKAQETAMTQLHEMEAQRNEGLLKVPRWIVVTLNNTGKRRPHERYDLMLIREWIAEGWLRTVVFRNEKRLGRQKFTLAWCEEVFESTGTDIYFTALRRPVDWTIPNDRMLFTINSLLATEERLAINKQTQDGLDRRYTNEGKGWPGLQQIGLKRDPLSGYMIEDELQTEMILRGAKLFASMSGRRSGIKQMAAQMTEEFGFELSPKQWERILKSEGFVTGEFFFNRAGRGRVALRPIELVNRIPPSLFLQVQGAFATNKGNRRSRPGDFVLLRGGAGQDVPEAKRGSFCKSCDGKLGAWLQGALNDTRYRHPSPVPPCCRGWGGIDRAEIEARVMPELWRLEGVRELREAAVRAAAADDVPVSAHLDAEQRRQIQRDIDDLEREINRLGRAYRRHYLHNGKAANSKKDHIAAYNELVAGLRRDKRDLEARLAAADALGAFDRSSGPIVNGDLSRALREVLTIDVPADDAACRRRAAVYGRIVTKVVIDKHEDGSYDIEIYGPLIPRDLPVLSVPAPSQFVEAELLDHEQAKANNSGSSPGQRREFEDARDDVLTRPELQVSSEGSAYDATCNRRFAWIHAI